MKGGYTMEQQTIPTEGKYQDVVNHMRSLFSGRISHAVSLEFIQDIKALQNFGIAISKEWVKALIIEALPEAPQETQRNRLRAMLNQSCLNTTPMYGYFREYHAGYRAKVRRSFSVILCPTI